MGLVAVPLLLLGFLVCIGLCMLSRYIVIKTTKSRFWGCMAFLVTFCAIFGHEIYTRSRFVYLCSCAGVHVYRSVPVKGFLYGDSPILGKDGVKYYLKKYGYQYIEAKGFIESREEYLIAKSRGYTLKPVLYRFSLDAEGNMIEKIIPKRESDFLFSIQKEIRISPYIREFRQVVMNTNTNEIFATYNIFASRGGWLANKFYDSLGLREGTGSICSEGGGPVDMLILSIPPITSLEASK